jgi:RNA polymerase sigma factor (sigma-70 family)
MFRQVAREGRRLGLSREDIHDAQQRGFFVFLRVVGHFDVRRCGGAERPAFRALLSLKLSSLVCDLAKHLRRLESHLDRSPSAARALRGALDGTTCSRRPAAGERAEDPALLAEQEELAARLAKALKRLTDLERWVVQGRLAGASFRVLAERAGVPPHRLKYVWRQARAKLADSLRGVLD